MSVSDIEREERQDTPLPPSPVFGTLDVASFETQLAGLLPEVGCLKEGGREGGVG